MYVHKTEYKQLLPQNNNKTTKQQQTIKTKQQENLAEKWCLYNYLCQKLYRQYMEIVNWTERNFRSIR